MKRPSAFEWAFSLPVLLCGAALAGGFVPDYAGRAVWRESTVELNDYMAYEPVRQADGTVRPRLLPSEKVAVFRKMPAFKLENDALMLSVVPELGGRIWRVYDKLNHRELVYHNNASKTADGLLPGVACAGGIAFDAGCGEPMQPVAGSCQTNADGSASCWLSPLRRDGGPSWRAEVRLAPSGARFSLRVESAGGRTPTVTTFVHARERPVVSRGGASGICGCWWEQAGFGLVARGAPEDAAEPVVAECADGLASAFSDYDGPFFSISQASSRVEWRLAASRGEFTEMTK